MFASYKQYILNGAPTPKDRYLKLFLEIIRDVKYPEHLKADSPQLVIDGLENGYVPCKTVRSGAIAGAPETLRCRYFLMNSYRFVLIFNRFGKNRLRGDGASKWLAREFPAAKLLSRGQQNVKLQVSSKTLFVHFEMRVPRQLMEEVAYYLKNKPVWDNEEE